jgi:predicted RNA-binding Zn ribbon-like protein
MSTIFASQRYGTSIAPDELRLTQELANTIGVARPATGQDLLGEAAGAQEWLDTQLADWGERHGVTPPRVELTGRSLRQLRQLRDRVRALLGGGAGADAAFDATISVAITADGSALAPRGDGLAWLTGAVAIELHLAGQDGQRRRLKVCRNERCGVAFHDQSKNNSRAWHDVTRCGNLANVRAYRERQRAATAQD